jgi:hypothetical protein
MEHELEQFRQKVERLRAGRQRGSLPYPEPLREFGKCSPCPVVTKRHAS